MSAIRLFSAPLSMFAMKAQIAALEKALTVEIVVVPFTDDHCYIPKHPDVVRINPKHQVPVLIHGDLEIFDSTQIFEYLEDLAPEPPLWPRDVGQRARARLLEHKSDEVFFPHVIRLMSLQGALEGEAAMAARRAALAYYAQMDSLLSTRAWLVGDYSFADIAFFMAQVFAERLGAPMTTHSPRLMLWRDQMTARPAVMQVMGPLKRYLADHGRPIPAFLEACRH
jgi:glutathione S-transferase